MDDNSKVDSQHVRGRRCNFILNDEQTEVERWEQEKIDNITAETETGTVVEEEKQRYCMCHNVLRFSFIMSVMFRSVCSAYSWQTAYLSSTTTPPTLSLSFSLPCTGISLCAALIFVSGIYRVLLLPPIHSLILLFCLSLSLFPLSSLNEREYFTSWNI